MAADPYTEAARFTMGGPSAAWQSIESEIRGATPSQLGTIESKLLSILESDQSTREAKSRACRSLRMAGSERSAPVLSRLLLDPELAADAQFALRSIPGTAADEALRKALPNARGLLKAGIIQTLGARRDRASVPSIAPLASDPDSMICEAALYALGQVGGEAALKALQAASVPASLNSYRQHGILLACESLAAEGKKAEAAASYRSVWAQAKDATLKLGALRGLVLVDPAGSKSELLASITGPNPALRKTAAKILCEAASAGLMGDALREFASWPADSQVAVLGSIDSPAALPMVRTAARSVTDEVRLAAMEALGRLGDASDVPALLAAAAASNPAQSAARKSLQRLRNPQVNDTLMASAKAGAAPVRGEAIRALVQRNQTGALPELLELAKDPEQAVRSQAVKALGQLGSEKDLGRIVPLLSQAGVEADREGIEAALSAICQRTADKQAAAKAILEAMPGTSSEARSALLRLLVQTPTGEALAELRKVLKSDDAAAHETALRTLVDWPTPEPAPDLLGLARSTQNPVYRTLALRGYVRMVALPAKRSPEQTVRLFADALVLKPSAPEKKAILSALSEIPHPSALEVATDCLSDPATETEAATSVVRLARKLQASDSDAASAAIQKILDTCKSPAARQLAESAGVVLGDMVNIAPQGTASSPDGLEKDGAANGDQAAIDGNPATYWDEQDGAKLYRLSVQFKQPERIGAISIQGYTHQNFAPKDFEVLCDGKPVKKVENASYADNFLVVPFPETTCQNVELKITGYYSGSPAIRELGIYKRLVRKPAAYRVLVFSKTLGFRHSNIPLGARTIKRLGAENGFAVDATEDSSVFTAANLARYRAVVFLSVTGDVLDAAQEQAFKDYVLGGGGFAAVHGGVFGPGACEEKWNWYGELCCTAFKNHSAVVPGKVDVEDRSHPSTVDLPGRWSRTDEWYNFSTNPRGCARVLATMDESSYQGGTMGKDHPIAWCRRMGQGKVWYTAMGHTEESFSETLFLKHIVGGIEAVAGAKPAEWEAKPSPVSPE